MKLVSAREVKQQFPEGTSSDLVELVFDADGYPIVKRVKISNVRRLVASDDQDMKAEAGWLLTKAAREAERDAAYQKHGDNWREHVKGDFWGEATEDEKRIVSDAIDMLVEISFK